MRDSFIESSVVAGWHEQTHTTAYKTSNWPAYNEALKRRGSLTIRWPVGDCLQSPEGWFDPAMTWETGKRARQQDYSDASILWGRIVLPPSRPSFITRVLGFVIRPPTLDRRTLEFSGCDHGVGLVAPP